MDDLDTILTGIEAEAAAATVGEWHTMRGTFGRRHDPLSATVYAAGDDLVYVARCDGSQPMIHGKFDALATAEFIAHAHVNVPRLCAAVRMAMEKGLFHTDDRERIVKILEGRDA